MGGNVYSEHSGGVGVAKVIATERGIAIGDYLSDILRATVSRDYVKDIKRLEKEGGVG